MKHGWQSHTATMFQQLLAIAIWQVAWNKTIEGRPIYQYLGPLTLRMVSLDNVKCFSTSQRHTLCAIGVRYCEIESNEVQGIPRYCKKVCRNKLGIICDLSSCQCVQSWLNSNADMMNTVIICLKWWPTLWAHRLHAYMDITSSRRCGLAIWLGEIYKNYQPLIDAYPACRLCTYT